MLPVSFHKTFIPERRFVGALLQYAGAGKQGTMLEMSEETGIPMGKVNGKMPAIYDYAIGMGLIREGNEKGSGSQKPVLTPFGSQVYREDKYLGEEITQWLAHLNLCRGDIGAKVWHLTFAQGRKLLGSSFDRKSLDEYLAVHCGKVKERIGPLVNTYLEDAALAQAGVLKIEGEMILRKKAPLLSRYALAYSAHIISLWEDLFPELQQITMADFNEKTYFADICLWSEVDMEAACTLLESRGYFTIDRQRKPWIIERRLKGSDIWQRIFEEMA